MRDALSICSVGTLFSEISACVSFLIAKDRQKKANEKMFGGFGRDV
jgi:hypothetical protein